MRENHCLQAQESKMNTVPGLELFLKEVPTSEHPPKPQTYDDDDDEEDDVSKSPCKQIRNWMCGRHVARRLIRDGVTMDLTVT